MLNAAWQQTGLYDKRPQLTLFIQNRFSWRGCGNDKESSIAIQSAFINGCISFWSRHVRVFEGEHAR